MCALPVTSGEKLGTGRKFLKIILIYLDVSCIITQQLQVDKLSSTHENESKGRFTRAVFTARKHGPVHKARVNRAVFTGLLLPLAAQPSASDSATG